MSITVLFYALLGFLLSINKTILVYRFDYRVCLVFLDYLMSEKNKDFYEMWVWLFFGLYD
jgi:hypothetical protein